MSTALNVAPLSGKIGVGNYILEIIPIDGGYRLTAKRGKEIQTMDVMNGIGIEKFEKINSTGDVDNYCITFTDNSTFEFSIETNAKTYAAAETERINAEKVRIQNEAERIASETTRKNTFAGYQGEIDKFKTEIVTGKDAATENTRIAIGEAGEALEVPSMDEFREFKNEIESYGLTVENGKLCMKVERS